MLASKLVVSKSKRGPKGKSQEAKGMLGWAVRLIMPAAGVAAGLVVAKDAPNFGLSQAMIGLMLITLGVFVVAFWPAHWLHFINRLSRESAPPR
jgi:hypothetical protein